MQDTAAAVPGLRIVPRIALHSGTERTEAEQIAVAWCFAAALFVPAGQEAADARSAHTAAEQ